VYLLRNDHVKTIQATRLLRTTLTSAMSDVASPEDDHLIDLPDAEVSPFYFTQVTLQVGRLRRLQLEIQQN
jgi:hypothetical protein